MRVGSSDPEARACANGLWQLGAVPFPCLSPPPELRFCFLTFLSSARVPACSCLFSVPALRIKEIQRAKRRVSPYNLFQGPVLFCSRSFKTILHIFNFNSAYFSILLEACMYEVVNGI